MEFKPKSPPRLMNAKIFAPGRMKLLESLFSFNMGSRLIYNDETKTLYIDLITDIMHTIEKFFLEILKLVKKVDIFVNCDGFDCREELVKDFTEMAHARSS
jgi:hypothetical protein